MADEQKGAELQGAADQTQNTNQQTSAEGTPKGSVTEAEGLKAALAAEREKRQAAEGEVKNLKDQVFLYQMNTPQLKQQEVKPEQPAQSVETPIPDFLSGMADDDVISAGELKRVIRGLKPAATPSQGPQYDERQWEAIGEQMLATFAPDLQEVFRGELSAKLQDPITGPLMANTIRNQAPILRPFVAYRMAKGQSGTAAVAGAKKDAAKVEKKEGAQKIVDNATKPTPTSAVAGRGAFDEASRFLSMSDDDFETEIQKAKSLPSASNQ